MTTTFFKAINQTIQHGKWARRSNDHVLYKYDPETNSLIIKSMHYHSADQKIRLTVSHTTSDINIDNVLADDWTVGSIKQHAKWYVTEKTIQSNMF